MTMIGVGGATPEWRLLKGTVAPPQIVTDLSKAAKPGSPERIRCPHCTWQPGADSRWVCWSSPGPEPPFRGCGTHWNTFATRGTCPGCGHHWQWTMCLVCKTWSRHDDWYQTDPDSPE